MAFKAPGKIDYLNKWFDKMRPWIFKKNTNENNFEKLNFGFKKKNHTSFTIMSYNILSQDLLVENSFLYLDCPKNVLTWPSRGKRILKEIQTVKPDILCLQEVNKEHYLNFFNPELYKNGYESIYRKRDFKLDGCAIYYKTNKFSLINYYEVPYLRLDLMNILNRPNVGLIAILKPHDNLNSEINNRLIIGTTHLLFNQRRGDIKLAQIRVLMAEIEKLAFRSTNESGKKIYDPFIICGDFNSLPDSPIYEFISKGSLDWENLDIQSLSGQASPSSKFLSQNDLSIVGINDDTIKTNQDEKIDNQVMKNIEKSKSLFLPEEYSESNNIENNLTEKKTIRHNLNLKSVFRSKNKFNQNFITTNHSQGSMMVDYIFYHQTKELNLIGFRKLLNENEVSKNIPYLPNEFLGSDHFSLTARFSITDKED